MALRVRHGHSYIILANSIYIICVAGLFLKLFVQNANGILHKIGRLRRQSGTLNPKDWGIWCVEMILRNMNALVQNMLFAP